MKQILIKILFCISIYIFGSYCNAAFAFTGLNQYDYGRYILVDTHMQNGHWAACFVSPKGKKYFAKVGDTIGKPPSNMVAIKYIGQFEIIVSETYLLNGSEWRERVFTWDISQKYKEDCWRNTGHIWTPHLCQGTESHVARSANPFSIFPSLTSIDEDGQCRHISGLVMAMCAASPGPDEIRTRRPKTPNRFLKPCPNQVAAGAE